MKKTRRSSSHYLPTIPPNMGLPCPGPPTTRQDRCSNESINGGSLYHWTLWASKRSMMILERSGDMSNKVVT